MTRPLDRLRWRLTAWYVGTFGAILLAVGIGLFVAIRTSIGEKLDRSLARAADEIVRNPSRGDSSNPTRADIVAATRQLKIPDRMLYVLDGRGNPIYPDTASAAVRDAAVSAARTAATSLEADIGHEHTLRVHAVRFVSAGNDTLIAAAAADNEELEDEFANLITLFAGALTAALIVVGFGGYSLARRSTVPVERSFEQMRRFMADAAHELRTPVSFLRAHAEVSLQQRREASDYEQTIREMGHEADRLGTIVNDLFTLARAEAGERRMHPERFYLDDVVLEGASDIRTVATLAGVHVDVTDFEEASVDADLALVRQLIRIVLDNAIKYTPAGGRVSLGVAVRGGRAVVVIEDTGIGIAPEALPHVYDRFFRAEAARSRGDGAGMGLSIARWIADMHGAEMRIASGAAKGTRVEIAFAAACASEANATDPGHAVTVA
jgi:signal transduction histidine kinase